MFIFTVYFVCFTDEVLNSGERSCIVFYNMFNLFIFREAFSYFCGHINPSHRFTNAHALVELLCELMTVSVLCSG
jgi:hypothetical protein